MKKITAKISLDHSELVVILDGNPEMEDEITIPLYGRGVVSGLNDNYMDTGHTYVMVKWANGIEDQFRYELKV